MREDLDSRFLQAVLQPVYPAALSGLTVADGSAAQVPAVARPVPTATAESTVAAAAATAAAVAAAALRGCIHEAVLLRDASGSRTVLAGDGPAGVLPVVRTVRAVSTAICAAAGVAAAVRRHRGPQQGELLRQQEGRRLLLAQRGRGGLPRHLRPVRALHSPSAADVAAAAAVAAGNSRASAPAVVAAAAAAALRGHCTGLRQEV